MWTCWTRPSCCFRHCATCIHPSIHTHSKELPSHVNLLALCITWSHSLCVNQIEISHTCKYAITNESSCISKAPLPSNSISFYWEPPLHGFTWSTTPKHPNNVHRYAKAYHFNITSKPISLCHQTPMVSSSLELGLHLDPLAFYLTLLTLWTISKSYFYKINVRLVNFLVSWFDFIKNLKG